MGLFAAALTLLGLYGLFDETMKANVILLRVIFLALGLLLLTHLLQLLCFLCLLGWLLIFVLGCHLGDLSEQLDILEVDGGLILFDKDGLPLGLEDGHQLFDLVNGTLLRLILVDIRQRLKDGLHVGYLAVDDCIDFFLEGGAVSPA